MIFLKNLPSQVVAEEIVKEISQFGPVKPNSVSIRFKVLTAFLSLKNGTHCEVRVFSGPGVPLWICYF